MAQCGHTTKAGKPCSRSALDGANYCIGHAPKKVKEAKGFGGPQEGSGRPPSPRAIDILKERIEADIDSYLRPIEDALTADTAIVKRHGDGNGGFHEEIEFVTDHNTRLKASGMALDRAYGKPKTTSEVSGAIITGGAELVENPALAEAARALLRDAANAS